RRVVRRVEALLPLAHRHFPVARVVALPERIDDATGERLLDVRRISRGANSLRSGAGLVIARGLVCRKVCKRRRKIDQQIRSIRTDECALPIDAAVTQVGSLLYRTV